MWTLKHDKGSHVVFLKLLKGFTNGKVAKKLATRDRLTLDPKSETN